MLVLALLACASEPAPIVGEWSSTDGVLTFWETRVDFVQALYDGADERVGTAWHEGDAWTEEDGGYAFVLFCQYGNVDGADTTDCDGLGLPATTDGLCRLDGAELECDLGGEGMTFYP